MVIILKIIHKIIDFIFPPQCYICKEMLHGENGLCFKCISKINFITNPKCYYCGRPFEFKLSQNEKSKHLLCAKCLTKKPKFDRCISAVRYDNISKKLILPFKHNDKTQLANLMGKIMFNTGKELLKETDIIIPIPIHFTRLLKRKYNQASLIGNIISKLSKKEIQHNNLVRIVATKSQGHLNQEQRKQNIHNAFTVRNPKNIKGKTILLIDDVYTTGVTANECAKTLKKHGAKKVFVLTFAHA